VRYFDKPGLNQTTAVSIWRSFWSALIIHRFFNNGSVAPKAANDRRIPKTQRGISEFG